jgi:hypothetical protein
MRRFGEAGGLQVEAAGAAGRLYMPTRSLPEDEYDVPRRMAEAPRSRVDAVLFAYSQATGASAASTHAVAAAAQITGAPSRVLTAAAGPSPAPGARSCCRTSCRRGSLRGWWRSRAAGWT